MYCLSLLRFITIISLLCLQHVCLQKRLLVFSLKIIKAQRSVIAKSRLPNISKGDNDSANKNTYLMTVMLFTMIISYRMTSALLKK